MRHLILAFLFAAPLAFAGCGDGGAAGACRDWCEWAEACFGGGGGGSINDCTRACQEGISQESGACQRAYEEFVACLGASDDCTTLGCESEGLALNDACSESVPR